jgi:hypothetical protein
MNVLNIISSPLVFMAGRGAERGFVAGANPIGCKINFRAGALQIMQSPSLAYVTILGGAIQPEALY